ncbi:MAG: thioredoxin domain-containing protein, partial [Bacteroidetes bacterium]
DREERPDVDDVYMTACQLASERGCGWPLNVFALPDGRPVWAGTYFPRKQWLEVLQYFANLWETDRAKVLQYADQLTQGIRALGDVPGTETHADFSADSLRLLVETHLATLDPERGGRQGAPKFPMPVSQELLLEWHHYSGDEASLQAALTTLDHMARGGIYDQLGGGFARYSTDARWLVPHFEKMLYDNGQLVSLYAHAFQLTQKPLYRRVVEETMAFVARELTSPEGGFYSSLDADSEGEEGKYYVWTRAELDSLLPPEVARVASDYWGVTPRGNWEDGKNVLHVARTIEEVARTTGLDTATVRRHLAKAREILFRARQQRTRPGLDDKILASWNALMLIGCTDAFRATGNDAFQQMALRNGRFLAETMMDDDGHLWRNYKEGRTTIDAFLDDYALTARAFIALYQITFDESWLVRARTLANYVLAHFADSDSPLFFYTSDAQAGELVARRKEVEDNVIPASNSAMAHVLFELGHYDYDTTMLQRARRMLEVVMPQVLRTRQAGFYANWCRLYLRLLRQPWEVAIVGPDAPVLRDSLARHYLPDALLLGGTDEGTLELLADKLQGDDTYIYVCQNKVCKLPVRTVAEALEQMQ